jgi:hypothetical protein
MTTQTEEDCTRSHPHEEMSKECELRTEIARLRNHLAQRTWVGLSYEEAKEIYSCIHGYDAPKRISEAIEAKLKAKNGFHSTEKNT